MIFEQMYKAGGAHCCATKLGSPERRRTGWGLGAGRGIGGLWDCGGWIRSRLFYVFPCCLAVADAQPPLASVSSKDSASIML
jgi:hypothetical protein